MKKFKNLFLKWLLFLVPFLFIESYCTYTIDKSKIASNNIKGANQIGNQFPFEYLRDTANNKITISTLTSDLTIVDLWFDQCSECLKEMSQFEQLLKGNENKISILSLSIDFPIPWKENFKTSKPNLSFLKSKVKNWNHGIILPPDSFEYAGKYVEKTLKTNSYPSYYVINKNGIIIETPLSAITYIQNNIHKEKSWFTYIENKFFTKETIWSFFWGAICYTLIFFIFYLLFRTN